MEAQAEKVYVAIGTDIQDGFGTLKWALRKWNSHSISIVILFAANDVSKEYVYTPFGKLPASSVNDEKLKVLRMIEERKIDNLLSTYVAFCGHFKVKAEILKIEKHDEPIHNSILELIPELAITKLVMGITFMKSSSWKSRSAISGSFYVHRHKPEFCELFIICGGQLVFLGEENNGELMEDDQGVMVAKVREKVGFKGWLEKMISQNCTNEKSLLSSPSSSTDNNSPDEWKHFSQEMENYFHQLLSSHSDAEDCEEENDTLETSPTAPDMTENMNAAEKIEVLKMRIAKAHEVIRLKRKQAKEDVERQTRAEWAICLCARRVEELEASTKTEKADSVELKKDLDTAKEELCEVQSEVGEKKSKLNSILELQGELSSKLQLSSLAKSRAEAELEKAVTTRAEMVRKIEELRRQRDVLQRRIEFCREKDAIGMATRLCDQLEFSNKEYTAEEIRIATDDFSERLRLKSAGERTNVYRGRINSTTVAVKLYNAVNGPSQEAFQTKVKLLSHIRHPHLLAMIGFCSDLKCIVFEYMRNGSVRDALLPIHGSPRRRNRGLNWHACIRIAAEVCSGLGFLHSAQPRPIAHGSLNLSKILLDSNLVAKIYGSKLGWCYDESDVRSDIRAFGNLVLQLLTGTNWAEPVQEAIMMDSAAVGGVLDEMAGEWPLELAMELVRIAKRCLSTNEGTATIARAIGEVRKRADELAANGGCEVAIGGGVDIEDSSNVPSAFLCPIFQDVMKNPQVAADGFSYELEAMEEWLGTGHDTSPLTNLKLDHKKLTPNRTLRSLIQDWHNKKSKPIA
ncbi:putative U-box domain-containing protein 50 [Cornus florida]|uniref:putative U-box domain-containing protein 50 n=1 Tax=Cornus florida TaxID=4283 RepID=UPI0028A17518|nr:putative U-box domain-containing protein 50 [Cornus florida]XP_059624138.1 putative U-box domain-containing protein 50 [Cornus florida]